MRPRVPIFCKALVGCTCRIRSSRRGRAGRATECARPSRPWPGPGATRRGRAESRCGPSSGPCMRRASRTRGRADKRGGEEGNEGGCRAEGRAYTTDEVARLAMRSWRSSDVKARWVGWLEKEWGMRKRLGKARSAPLAMLEEFHYLASWITRRMPRGRASLGLMGGAATAMVRVSSTCTHPAWSPVLFGCSSERARSGLRGCNGPHGRECTRTDIKLRVDGPRPGQRQARRLELDRRGRSPLPAVPQEGVPVLYGPPK